MNPRAQRANNPLLTGDPLDPRFDPPTQEEQDYIAEHGLSRAGEGMGGGRVLGTRIVPTPPSPADDRQAA